MLDCCSDVDDVLDTLLATPLVVTPLDILVLVVMAKVLLEGSEELTDMACMLVVEDWWLYDISEFGFDVGVVLVILVACTYVICTENFLCDKVLPRVGNVRIVLVDFKVLVSLSHSLSVCVELCYMLQHLKVLGIIHNP